MVSSFRLLPFRFGLALRLCSLLKLRLRDVSVRSVAVRRPAVSSVPLNRSFSRHLVDRQMIISAFPCTRALRALT